MMNDKPIEHPTSKQLRKTISLQNQTIEMVAKDRRWLEDKLEQALADNVRLRGALEGVIRIADRDCPEFRAARAALAEQEKM